MSDGLTVDAETSHASMSIEKKVMEILNAISETAVVPEGGHTRLLYTDEWFKAQDVVRAFMNDAGLHTYFDEVGNLFGRLDGHEASEAILTGSHIDTVRNGGKFDGQFGIAASIIAVGQLYKKHGKPKKSIEVVSICDEESTRFDSQYWGSRNIKGAVTEEEASHYHDKDGISLAEAVRSAGFSFKDGNNIKNYKYYLETHIEQGQVLESEGMDIGLVTAIVGITMLEVEVNGIQNHAGTTPMDIRSDALYAAAKMTAAIHELALSYGRPMVATVGTLNVTPNTSNVIPGMVKFLVDIRHTDAATQAAFTAETQKLCLSLGKELGVTVRAREMWTEPPVPMDNHLLSVTESACLEEGVKYKLMPSGAGHDAQVVAEKFPSAMIFVPSRGGKSHCPEEYSSPEQLAKGVAVLERALYELAYKNS